ncbi:MAG: hypothetical protein MUQ56_13370 [Thermoleophilia bacterium]|nr:hypothetical protein [Thermoleophilia bacterium]
MPLALVLAVLALVFLLLALIPSRRLWHTGVPLWPRVVYLVTLIALGLIAFEARPLARYLLPLIVLLFLLPFSGLPERWTRWRRRTSRGDEGEPGGTGADEGGPPVGASRVPRGWARKTPPDSIIDGQAVHLESDEPPQP